MSQGFDVQIAVDGRHQVTWKGTARDPEAAIARAIAMTNVALKVRGQDAREIAPVLAPMAADAPWELLVVTGELAVRDAPNPVAAKTADTIMQSLMAFESSERDEDVRGTLAIPMGPIMAHGRSSDGTLTLGFSATIINAGPDARGPARIPLRRSFAPVAFAIGLMAPRNRGVTLATLKLNDSATLRATERKQYAEARGEVLLLAEAFLKSIGLTEEAEAVARDGAG